MEQQFQTSFIPKKPITESRAPISRASVSFVMIFATIVLVVAAFMLGGAFFYKIGMEKKKTALDTYIAEKFQTIRSEKEVLYEVTRVDKRIRAAKDVVSAHVLVSPIFNRLRQLTLKTIQFTKFEFTGAKDTRGIIEVKMSGKADRYASIANQSDVLAGVNGQQTYFINPIFSNLSLDDKARVSFDLTFKVDPDFISYTDTLTRLSAPLGAVQQ